MSTVSADMAGAPGEGRGLGGSLLGGGSGGVTGTTTLFVLVMAVAIVQFGGDVQRVLLSCSLALSFYSLITFAPRIGIPALLVFLNFLGFLRRYSVPILGYSSMDALLLITPIATGLFLLNHLLNRRIQWDTRLSKMIGWLTILMMVQIFNPFQGGVVLGLMGMMSFTVPVVWYYIGRTFSSRALLYLVLNTVIVAGAISATYGLWQTFFGFTDIEKEWFALTGTHIGQTTGTGFQRVFATFSSFAEYTRITTIGACACLGLMKRNRLYVLPFLLFATCIVLSSSRGSLLSLASALAYCWAVQGKTPRSWLPRVAVAVAFALGGLLFGLTTAVQSGPTEGAVGAVLNHQAQGILKVTSSSQSTAGSHLGLMLQGILGGFTNPLGTGIGASTLHASSYTSNIVTTESDVSNMFGSLGAIGGILYAAVVGYSIYIVGLMWHRYRDPAVLGTLTMLLCTMGTWLVAGQYLLPFVLFLLIGIMDSFYLQEARSGAARQRRAGKRESLTRRAISPRAPGADAIETSSR